MKLRSLNELENLLRAQPTSLQQAAADSIGAGEMRERFRQFSILMRSIGVKKITVCGDIFRLEPNDAVPQKSDFTILFGLWAPSTPRGFSGWYNRYPELNEWLLYGPPWVYESLNGAHML